jgi:hypothetical protein
MLRQQIYKGLIIIIACLSNGVYSLCQRTHSKQVSFTWDNDYLMFQGNDRYYTNALYLKYDKISKNTSEKVLKKVDHLEIGQIIYKQYLRKITRVRDANPDLPFGVEHIDRPITGYLFAKVSQSKFLLRNQLLDAGVSVRVIGPLSFGQEVQNFWHKEQGIKDFWNWVWDYQLTSEVGINAHCNYAFSLIKNNRTFIQIIPVTHATIGTTFTNAGESILFQLGKFNKMSESSYWNARIENKGQAGNKDEFFIFLVPQVSY